MLKEKMRADAPAGCRGVLFYLLRAGRTAANAYPGNLLCPFSPSAGRPDRHKRLSRKSSLSFFAFCGQAGPPQTLIPAIFSVLFRLLRAGRTATNAGPGNLLCPFSPSGAERDRCNSHHRKYSPYLQALPPSKRTTTTRLSRIILCMVRSLKLKKDDHNPRSKNSSLYQSAP